MTSVRGWLALCASAAALVAGPALHNASRVAALAGPGRGIAAADSPRPARIAPRGEVVEASQARLIYFGSRRCPPCRAMLTELDRAEARGVVIDRVDVDLPGGHLARDYRVTRTPTVVVVDGEGVELGRKVGFARAGELEQLLRRASARPSRPTSAEAPNPRPWATAVRIRVDYGESMSLGSGTVVLSDGRSAVVLTCAHIFADAAGKSPRPGAFRRPIAVEMFEGAEYGLRARGDFAIPASGEAFAGSVIDYDANADVGLIRIQPGRPLPASRVAPERWSPAAGMHMLAIGCPGGADAVVWDTKVTRDDVILTHTDTGGRFRVVECDRKPEEGRSGGGLYTDDGYVAGVCGYASADGHGLYAHPTSLRAVLDRNGLASVHSEAAGSRGQPPRPTPQSPPIAGAIEAAEAAVGPDLWHWLLGGGFALSAGVGGIALARSKLRAWADRLAAPASQEDQAAEDFRRLWRRFKADREAKARADQEEKELAEFIKLLDSVGKAPDPAPTSAPAAAGDTPSAGA